MPDQNHEKHPSNSGCPLRSPRNKKEADAIRISVIAVAVLCILSTVAALGQQILLSKLMIALALVVLAGMFAWRGRIKKQAEQLKAAEAAAPETPEAPKAGEAAQAEAPKDEAK